MLIYKTVCHEILLLTTGGVQKASFLQNLITIFITRDLYATAKRLLYNRDG